MCGQSPASLLPPLCSRLLGPCVAPPPEVRGLATEGCCSAGPQGGLPCAAAAALTHRCAFPRCCSGPWAWATPRPTTRPRLRSMTSRTVGGDVARHACPPPLLPSCCLGKACRWLGMLVSYCWWQGVPLLFGPGVVRCLRRLEVDVSFLQRPPWWRARCLVPPCCWAAHPFSHSRAHAVLLLCAVTALVAHKVTADTTLGAEAVRNLTEGNTTFAVGELAWGRLGEAAVGAKVEGRAPAQSPRIAGVLLWALLPAGRHQPAPGESWPPLTPSSALSPFICFRSDQGPVGRHHHQAQA